MRTLHHRAERGLSLVELLVGVAIGLLAVAAAAMLAATQAREQRGAVHEARLMQELRSAVDLIGRDLRRAGARGDAAAGVWAAGASGVTANPYAAFAPAAAASDAASLRYSRDASENHALDTNEEFGLRLAAGVVEMRIGSGSWQALTDSGTLVVTAFSLVPQTQQIELQDHCTSPCPSGSTACPPRLVVRSVALRLSARSARDAGVERSLASHVRLRNDAIVGACAA